MTEHWSTGKHHLATFESGMCRHGTLLNLGLRDQAICRAKSIRNRHLEQEG